jgi:hypothetical protein
MQATVVSFLPWKVESTKPGVIPDTYSIPAAVGKYPGVLVINNAISPIYLDGDRGTFPTTIPVEELAGAIVGDYNVAFLGVDGDSHPALFWVEGAQTPESVVEKFKLQCESAKAAQNRWFLKLIRMADDDWAKFHQHKMITDIQRFAARTLGLNREWAIEPEPVTMIKCPACTSLLEDTAVVCKNCRAILKPEEAKKLGIVFTAA